MAWLLDGAQMTARRKIPMSSASGFWLAAMTCLFGGSGMAVPLRCRRARRGVPRRAGRRYARPYPSVGARRSNNRKGPMMGRDDRDGQPKDDAYKNVGMTPVTGRPSLDELAENAKTALAITEECATEVRVLERLLQAARERYDVSLIQQRETHIAANRAFVEATGR